MTSFKHIEAVSQHMLRIWTLVGISSVAAACIVFGAIWGVYHARIAPHVLDFKVVGSSVIRAGDELRLTETDVAPRDCILTVEMWIKFPPDTSSEGKPNIQALGNVPVPADGIIHYPTPVRMLTGTGQLFKRVSDQGCGAFSGVLPPLASVSKPETITVLPSEE